MIAANPLVERNMEMTRVLTLTTALAIAGLAAFASPASAQTYGGITLSFGSGSYGGYSYDEGDDDGYYRYADPGFPRYYDEDGRYEAWRLDERREQIERWQDAQERRRYWQQERWEDQPWGDDDN